MTPAPTNPPAWDESLLRDPHAATDKRERVRRMFAAIAPSYDLNNRLHSFWQDQRWRRKALNLALVKWTDRVLDVACGTGDLTWQFVKQFRSWLPHPFATDADTRNQVLGVDFTFPMVSLAVAKGNLHEPFGPVFLNADAQALPLPDQSADVVSIAFGIRNVQDPLVALREFHRVLRPGGRVIILEFSLPTNRILRGVYNVYFRKILPVTATLISRDKTGAYKYLPESVNTFISRDRMVQMLNEAGFERVEQFPMTFGVCVCYRGFVRA